MNLRERMIKRAYDRSFFLKVRNPGYVKILESLFRHLIREDLGRGDITTDTLLNKRKSKAKVIAKESGILAGGEEFRWLCRNNGLFVRSFKKDGESFRKGDKLFYISGPRRYIFYLERTGLNLLQRMSGIATETSEVMDKARKKGLRITATRKTRWGCIDKKAVTVGGGLSHRLGLHESFLIKDNHLAFLRKQGIQKPIETALDRAWKKRNKSVFVEIEVNNSKEAMQAARKFRQLQEKTEAKKPCVIMLDNMDPSKIKKTINMLKDRGLYDHVLLEASGDIAKENVLEYAESGVDVCSLGSITHSARSVDISQICF